MDLNIQRNKDLKSLKQNLTLKLSEVLNSTTCGMILNLSFILTLFLTQLILIVVFITHNCILNIIGLIYQMYWSLSLHLIDLTLEDLHLILELEMKTIKSCIHSLQILCMDWSLGRNSHVQEDILLE